MTGTCSRRPHRPLHLRIGRTTRCPTRAPHRVWPRANHARTCRRARIASLPPRSDSALVPQSSSPPPIQPRSDAEAERARRRDPEIARGDVVGLVVVGARPGADLALHLLRHWHRRLHRRLRPRRGMVSPHRPCPLVRLDLRPLPIRAFPPACISLPLLFASAPHLQGHLHHGEQPHRGRHQGAQDHI